MVRVVVVGGGIAGLAAAHRLAARPGIEVDVVEASAYAGGKLRTAEVGGVVVDVGAEAMLARRPEAVGLAHEIGLDLVRPATTAAQLWNRGRLVAMPRTVMGVPLDVRDAREVLTPQGLARAEHEADLPPTRLEGDVSVGDLVERRLGAEVVDRLVEPLLGGVYAGHARELSALAAVPQLVRLLEHHHSLSRAAAASTPAESGTSVFAGIRGGVARLAQTLAEGVPVRTGATVRDLVRTGRGWDLVVGPVVDPEVVSADAVVLATPAPATARLLREVAPHAAAGLARVEYASMAIVTLAFAAGALPGTSGSGFLVPPVDGRLVKAATFSFAKWDWVRDAGKGVVVVRCSIGRHREEQQLQRTDDELVRLALDDLADAIGLAARPVDQHVQRWGGALPQYAVGHLDRVAAIRRALADLPGLAVCGAAYDGLGIPACIASAERAVGKVLTDLAGPLARMEP